MDKVKELISKIRSLTRYESETVGNDDLGYWARHEIASDGDWVKFEDLKSVLDEFEKDGKD